MERIEVKSTTIAAIGYDVETAQLEVEFHNGGTYLYEGVECEEFARLITAKSKGSYWAKAKDKYGYRRLEG